MDWWGGTGGKERERGRGGWRTYNYPSQHKFSSNPSVPFLGCQRVFFFGSFRGDRIQRQSREGATSNSALGSLSLSREGESEKTSSIQAKRPFDSKKSI